MREIEFRAKCKLLKRWMYGNYYKKKNGKVYINSTEVYPETVGQYTGLKDKNGTKIYEGDIVTENAIDEDTQMLIFETVEYGKGAFLPFGCGDFGFWISCTEVIGNIHEETT